MRRYLNDKIVKGAVRVVARDLEYEVSAWPRLKPQTFTFPQNRVLAGDGRHGRTPFGFVIATRFINTARHGHMVAGFKPLSPLVRHAVGHPPCSANGNLGWSYPLASGSGKRA